MNNIEELINRLCPNGVEYDTFGNVLNYEQPTKYIVNSTNYNNDYSIPVLTAGQTFILGYTNEKDGVYNASKNNPVIIFDDFTGAIKWVDFPFKVKSSAMKMLTSKTDRIILRYVYHIMSNKAFSSSEHKRLWIGVYSSFECPVPPIEVQKEIVRILDQLSKFTEEIKEKLAMEFTARKQQYEFYRDELLNIERRIKNIAWVKMDDIFYIRNGYTPAKNNPEYWNDGIVPWFRLEDIRQNGRLLDDAIQHVSLSAVKGGKYIKSGSLIISTTATIGEHALVNIDCLTNQQITSFTIKENMFNKINIKYIFYYFFKFGKWCVNNANNCGNLPIIGLRKLNNYLIPIPILEEQNHIVSILDKFDKIVNDLTEGLPAEIEARQKQFEYYREKLLTFKEKVN